MTYLIISMLHDVGYQISALNLVALSSRAVDVYKAAATVYASATVVSGPSAFNLTSYIDRGLSTALNAGDADLLGRTIALSASSFASSINCTAALPQVLQTLPLPQCILIPTLIPLLMTVSPLLTTTTVLCGAQPPSMRGRPRRLQQPPPQHVRRLPEHLQGRCGGEQQRMRL